MGSYIYLRVGKIEIDWGKNDLYNNYSNIYLYDDVKTVPYYYADNEVVFKEAYSKKLKDVKERLELSGITLHAAKEMYEECVEYIIEPEISFEEYASYLSGITVDNLESGDIPQKYKKIMEQVLAVITLRLLVDNPKISDVDVVWEYSDLVEGGWVSKDELYIPISEAEKYLIVTEGSSDTFIIKKALEIFTPDIVDFFKFIDMKENYPFTGTGNLYRFCQGLVSIGILNKVVVIYDNDTAGREKYKMTKKLNLPSNMVVTKLPSLDEFSNFPTIGPNRKSKEDINNKAVAIEHYLDLNYKCDFEPAVQWTTYNKKLGTYQGELINKEYYVKQFKEVQTDTNDYNFSKLRSLISHLYLQCIKVR